MNIYSFTNKNSFTSVIKFVFLKINHCHHLTLTKYSFNIQYSLILDNYYNGRTSMVDTFCIPIEKMFFVW